MKFYLEDIVTKARDLRRAGLSAQVIGQKLGVSEMSVLRWCFDIPSNNKSHLRSLSILDASRSKSAKLVKDIKFSKDLYKIFASLLYWCEGSKYPASNAVCFANSDPSLVKTFVKFFRKGFKPKEEKFKVHLQIHSTHDFQLVKSFWSKLLKISPNQFYKPTITQPTKTMKRINYQGTCTIRYYDVNILMEMTGIYESFTRRRGRVA